MVKDRSETYAGGVLADGPVRGRGAQLNPTNRFEKLSLHVLGEHLDQVAIERGVDALGRQVRTQVYRDRTRSIINPVDSPDLPFKWSINPYRGCEHGCIYCYARPTHETLGLSSGLDFESKLLAKVDAPSLLRQELGRAGWKGEPIMMSGVTDCYQPVEAQLKITRGCLEVMAEARQAVSIITKSRLILRDLDLLTELNRHDAVHVAISVTTLDARLAGALEPRAASPRDRLWTIRRLASAGIPVHVMVAPIIPGLNDREMPAILKAVAEAGASGAGYVMLRLPYQIKDLFDDWLARHAPHRRTHVQSLIRDMRGGKLYDATWGQRLRGEGAYADQIRQTFDVFSARCNLRHSTHRLNTAAFRRPQDVAQLALFEDN
ncbi:MAG: PA0069 family radical SAM protein [Planctomycetes bacterium]|nr:PA0069 family radical SAM protein [Planctomycetota bacterium]